jgi:hypothetical protein
MDSFINFVNRRRQMAMQQHTGQPDGETTATVTEIPKIDSNDVIGSLNGILGPSPEERAEEEQRLQQHRKKMHGWTALFNGLRHLGNLYYATKGAPGQKFNDPHAQIEQQYQDERKRLADIHAADRNYYANLWGLYRQVNDEQRKNALAEAQAQYYGTRDEVARQKAELEKLKAVRVIKQKDGSLMKFDPVSGEIEPLSEADPLYEEYMRSQINKNNRTGLGRSGRNNGTYGYRITKHVDPATGDVITEREPTTGENDKNKKYTKYKKGNNTGNQSPSSDKWSKYKKK